MKTPLILVLSLLFLNPAILKSEEGDSAGYKRTFWFYSQRYAPDDTISEEFMQNALEERDDIRASGYFLSSSSFAWISLGGLTGRINTVKYSDENTLVIGAPNGGIWKGTNFRTSSPTWIFMDPNSNLKSNTSGAVAIDNSTNPPTIYYGTGEGIYGFIYAYLGNGIYKTTNWGDSWTHISSGLEKNLQIFRITIRPNYPSHVFAATSEGLFRSTNSGSSWSVVSGTSGLHCNDIVFSQQTDTKAFITGPKSDHLLIAGVAYRVSTDGGVSFAAYGGLDFVPNGRTHIAVYENDDDYIYAITDNDAINAYRSTNGGESFTGPVSCTTSAQLGYNMFITISSNDPSVAFVGGVNLYKTTNYGANYNPVSNNMHDDFHYMAINPENASEMAVVTDGGIYLSTNGGVNWTGISGGLPLMNTYRIYSSNNAIHAGIQDNGFVRKTSGAFFISYWQWGDGTSILNSKFNSDIVLGITGNDGVIHRSTDGGDTRQGITELTGKWDGGNDWIGAITEHPEDAGYFYTARRNAQATVINIWRSTTYGANWEGPNPLGSVSGNHAPQNIVFSTKDPDIVYMSSSGHIGAWPPPFTFGRGLFKSTSGGVTWIDPPLIDEEDDEAEIPFNYITRVITAPADNPSNPDEVYITLSGHYQGTNEGHVFKSTNEGNNWVNINGNLPNTPVNDIIVWHPSSCGSSQKNITVATDVGVFTSSNGGSNWYELAQSLPLSPVMDIEYIPLFNIIRVATFGMGVWEIAPGPLYIAGIFQPSGSLIHSSNDIIVCSGGKLKLTNGQTVKFSSGKKIIVEDGGEIEISSGSVTFTSIGSSWGGIELNEDAVWDVDSCNIANTTTPLKIIGSEEGDYNSLNLNKIWASGPIEIDNRSNVNVTNCKFNYYYGSFPTLDVCGVISNGSDNVNIEDNIIKANPTIGAGIFSSTTISINYGSNVSIQYNTITNISDGIFVSNSSPLVKYNTIGTTDNLQASIGIDMNYSYSSTLTRNEISNCTTGVSLYSSSPVMHENSVTSSISGSKGLYANYNSSPRLKPVFAEPGVWDGGKNEIYTTGSSAKCIHIYDGIPDIDYGCNTFEPNSGTGSYFVEGTIFASSPPPSGYVYDMRNNTWLQSFNSNKISIDVDYEEYPEGCDIDAPGGGSESENENIIENSEYSDNTSQPLIVHYGNNIYDTLATFTQTRELTEDMALFLGANKNELLGSFSSAFSTYEQIIEEYPDSTTALYSLKRLLRCRDRMNSDTAAYSNLRQYYLSLAGNNQTDTAFSQVAGELATKCLVRMGQCPGAITEYESVISTSTDSLQVLGAELNIIEIYMLMSQGGDAPSFTGRYAQLKPMNLMEGFRMIKQKLHGTSSKSSNNVIPMQYSLSQNYPNPFNPVTKINYELPRTTKVNLVIYDILGREVIRLVNNEFKEAGRYTVEFNGRNLASGVYFYRIEAGDFVQSKKMVLVK